MLYEFLAWLQEQEHFWEVEPPDDALQPALPDQVSEDHELHAPEHCEAEASGAEVAQVRALA